MALTIRKISEEAEYNLSEIINNSEIKTSTKAIEFVLENYAPTLTRLENEKKKSRDLERKLNNAEINLMKIKEGFEVIFEMMHSDRKK